VLALCRQFHCLPSAVLAEDAGLLRLLAIEREGTRQEGREGVDAGAE
jgi:hypothetical protein